ncbi:hypothetical protein ACS0TY_019627 [Phlomoides rotata]
MSESAKVRLVRCPKCENLLPEVTEFSVYQCGGCGAVLRANNKGVDLDTFSEKSDEERIVGNMEKISDRYEKMSNVSERRMMDMSDGSESDVRSTISSSGRAERRRVLRENNRTSLSTKEGKWDVEADVVVDKRSDELHRARIVPDFDDLEIRDNENGSRRPGRVVDGRYEEEEFWRAQRMDAKMGPLNHASRSSYDVDGSSNVGDDRAELLRKLDELQDQIRRSGDLGDKGKEKIPLDMRMPHQDPYAYDNWYHDASLERNRVSRPVYPPPMMHRQEMGGNGFYPPWYQGYGDPLRSHMHRRGPSQAPMPYQSHAYASGPYMDDGMGYMDAVEPYPPHYSRHHPSCSCYQCRTKRQVPTPMLASSYSDKYSNVSNDYHDTPGSFASRDYNQRISNPPHSRSHARWPSDVNSDVDGFVRRRPIRPHLASGAKNCRPLAGGAPFLTCCNCFELLLLPKKVLISSNRKKLRCGGCSTVIAVSVSNKSLVVSFDVEAKDNPVKVDEKRDDDHLNQAKPAFSSDDYDNSGYDFHSMDRESGQVSTHQGRANNSTELRNRHSTSTYTSEVEEDVESLTTAKDSGPAEKRPAPPAGSSLQDYFEYSNKYHVAKDAGEGNRSSRSELDKVLPIKATNRQMLRKESTATEIDLSSNEYSNTGTTFDSSEASREGFFAGIMKKSYKDSQKSKDSISEQENGNVTVNGHLISDRLIKKAEKVAGQIHPGHYWYDFRAGFWGAVGGPCLGIVPPFIEEFNYPMPENCAGGNTGVFVNGRELNHKDMNLLGSRGLPTEGDRSYIVEISGRVLDEDTGEELESLGKLAPTVERMKRGFGMRAPRAVS